MTNDNDPDRGDPNLDYDIQKNFNEDREKAIREAQEEQERRERERRERERRND